MQKSIFSLLVFFVILSVGTVLAFLIHNGFEHYFGYGFLICTVIIAYLVSASIKIANQWDRAIVLRLGHFHSLRGPGLFFIIPVIDTIAFWIDIRVIASSFKAEKTLTKDTVPVDVDAVLFWKVIDPKKASLEVADYRSAIGWASQTALRDVIGKTMLSDMLEGRSKISNELQIIIDERTEPWGINVISVEVKDVLIPSRLGRCDVHASAGRKRASSTGYSWRFRKASGRKVWRSGEDLYQ